MVVSNTAGTCDEYRGDADGECGGGGADDHDAAGEPDSDGRADGDVHGGGRRDGAAELPVAEERSEHRGGDGEQLHDTGNGDDRQRIDIPRGGDEHGWECHE